MSLEIGKYKKTMDLDEGFWFDVPAYCFGLENDPNSEKLKIEMKLKFYPDKVSRRHARTVVDPMDFIQRRRGKTDISESAEKIRILKYTYIIEDFRGLEEDGKNIECSKENIMMILEMFPELLDWIDEISEDINNYVEEKKEEEAKN